jgi:hypothetical protein
MPALEAVALEFGKSVLPAISRLASEYIEKAREYKEDDIRACEYYLEAARMAIDGLEAEYDQILVQAKHCLALNLDFKLKNTTGRVMTALYVSPHASDYWGGNILDDGVQNGDTVNVTFPP